MPSVKLYPFSGNKNPRSGISGTSSPVKDGSKKKAVVPARRPLTVPIPDHIPKKRYIESNENETEEARKKKGKAVPPPKSPLRKNNKKRNK